MLKSCEFTDDQNNTAHNDDDWEHQNKRIKLSTKDEENEISSQSDDDLEKNSDSDYDEINENKSHEASESEDEDELSDDDDEDDENDSDDSNIEIAEKDQSDSEPWAVENNKLQDDSDTESESEDNTGLNWKEGLAKRAIEDHLLMQSKSQNLMKLIYGKIRFMHLNNFFAVAYLGIEMLFRCI